MQHTGVLFLGNRRDLASLASLAVEHFPDLKCEFRPGVDEAIQAVRAAQVRLIIFYWKSDEDQAAFDRLSNELGSSSDRVPVIVITDQDRPAVTLHALRSGAVDCLCRPVNPNRLAFLMSTLLCPDTRPAGPPVLKAGKSSPPPAPLTYESDCMQELVDSLRLAARSDATILLTGETGTGKNHLAAFAHCVSPRRQQPLVTVDCAASAENLIESELFGHVRGAFTGADRDHTGKLERAGRGTVLLDEINSLPLSCQARLLRALEERVFEKLGGERVQRFTGRVIALSNKSLEQEVAERRFREDLYYRLNVISFHVPPLRERPEDIPATVDMFLNRLTGQNGSHVTDVSPEAMGALMDHVWPGNLRELRNVLERAVALSDSAVIEPRHLHLPSAASRLPVRDVLPPDGTRLTTVRHDAERRELQRVLQRLENNRTQAAKHLGISRSALYKRLDKLGLT